MRKLSLLLLLFGFVGFSAPVLAGEAAQFKAAKRAAEMLRKQDPGVTNLAEWERVASEFVAFHESYPKSTLAPEALFKIAGLYQQTYEKRQSQAGLSRAILFYERLARDFPGHALADDGLLYLGDLQRKGKKDRVAARAAYYEVVDRYSDGDVVHLARERLGLAKTTKVAKKKELHKEEIVDHEEEEEDEGSHAESTIKRLIGGLSATNPKEKSKEIYARKRLSDRPLIVIDPGHGGDDKGAVGLDGYLEKDVALSIGIILDELLRERLRARTKLTRARDIFIPLAERTKMANDSEGDLFISIHANASPRKNVRGIETYYLDNTNDKSSLRLAKRENMTAAIGGGGDLGFMISDLIQNAKLEDSISFAHYIQNNLVGRLSRYYTDVRDLGVKKAPFYVLVGAHMPCVLAEVSFMDHPIEGRRLIDRRYQKVIAESLYLGIRSYFERE